MSFSFDITNDLSGSGSFQGQLSSSYTNALSAFLQGDGATFVAFLSHSVNGLSIEDALAVKTQVEAGQFSLSGLFGAAQSKTGAVDGADITDPQPTLTVLLNDVTVTIDLAAMLDGADTATWTSGSARNTVHHTREFFTESVEPDGWSPNWANPVNEAPTAASFAESVTEFDIRAGQPVDGNNLFSIDLLQGAEDPEEDPLSVVADTVAVSLNGQPVSSDAFTVQGNTLVIDTNSAFFDLLFQGQKWTFDVSYDITDGVNVVPSSGTVEVTGTADLFSVANPVSFTKNTGFDSTSWSGSFDVLIPTSSLVEGADQYFGFTGTASVSAAGDLRGTTETITFTVEGAAPVTLGGGGPGPFGGHEPGDNNYAPTTVNQPGILFASDDRAVHIEYDSNTSSASNGNAGVDELVSVSVELTGVTYWA